MERLTIRTENGAKIRSCTDPIGYLKRMGFANTAYHISDTINRLAAYEDVGLSPEEVAELVRLKQCGRLVELPVAVGDIVWEIRTSYTSRHGGKKYDYAMQQNLNHLYIAPHTCYAQTKKCTKTDLNFLGKTIFLTEAEALAIIKKAKDEAKEKGANYGTSD